MFCTNCGTRVGDDATFCTNCGQALRPAEAVAAAAPAPAAAPETVPAAAPAPEEAPAPETVPAAAPAEAPASAAPPYDAFPDTQPASAVPPYGAFPDAQPVVPPKKKKAPVALIAVLIVLLLALVAGGIFLLRLLPGLGGKESTGDRAASNLCYVTENLSVFSDEDTEKITLYSLSADPVSVDGIQYRISVSDDRTKAALISAEDGGALHLYDHGGIEYLDDGVVYCRISRSGDALLFSRENPETGLCTLYLWRDGRSDKITDRTLDYISPLSMNGQHFLYTSWDKSQDPPLESPVLQLYLSDGTDDTLLGEYEGIITGLAVSDDGSQAYAIVAPYDEEDALLLYFEDGEEIVLSDELNRDCYFFFNYDCTQLICQDTDESWYLYRGAEDRIKLDGKNIHPMTPSGLLGCGDINQFNGTDVPWAETILGYRDFRNVMYADQTSDGTLTLYRIDEEYVSRRIERYLANCLIAHDGRTVLYYKSGAFYRIDCLDEEADAVQLVRDNAVSCEFSDDAGVLVYLNTDDELYYAEADDEPVRIARDIVETGYAYTWDDTNRLLYYIDDGELMVSKDGGKGEPVEALEGLTCSAVVSNSMLVYVEVKDSSGEYAVYLSQDGRTFEKSWSYTP